MFDGGLPADERPPRSILWRVGILVALAAATVAVLVLKAHRSRTPGAPAAAPTAAVDAAPAAAGRVLATVNGTPITMADLEAMLAQLPDDVRPVASRQRHLLLDEMVSREVLLQEARRLKVNETEQYRSVLAQLGDRPNAEEMAMLHALIGTQVPGPPVNEGAVENYIATLRERAEIMMDLAWVAERERCLAELPLNRALASGRPVLAEFGRGACIPCKAMKPILDALSQEYAGRVEVVIVDVSEYPDLAQAHNVRAIPTQVFYDAAGRETFRHEGFFPREDIVKQLAKMGVQ